MATETKRKDVYSIVTERILELLAKGVAPWHKPWNAAGGLMQYNYVSKKPYRGINVWMLAGAEYTCPFWLSYKQTSELGGEVTKGEHGSMIVYFQWVEPKDSKKTTDAAGKDHKPEKIPLLRYYMVWNLEQTTLWEKLKSKILPQLGEVKGFDPIAECEAVLPGMPNAPVVTHKGNRACYSPGLDSIAMPDPKSFDTPAEYYSTLFHELTHSTGHKDRLNRPTLTEMTPFGTENYSKEELVAEMGAAFLCAHCHTENLTINNSAAYIANWMQKLTEQPKLVVQAAGLAQKATDHILDIKWEV